MSGPRVTQGVRVPLFDRLAADTAPHYLRDQRGPVRVSADQTSNGGGGVRRPGHPAGEGEPRPRDDQWKLRSRMAGLEPIDWATLRKPARPAADAAPGGGCELQMLDRAGLAASIAHELDRLLNTRTPLAADDLGRRPRSTLDYGLPDLSLFWPLNAASEARLVELIAGTVAAFEPRLLRPQVSVERLGGPQRRLRATIAGDIALDGMLEPVTFPILLSDSASESP